MHTPFELPGLEHAYGEAGGTADNLFALTAVGPKTQDWGVSQ